MIAISLVVIGSVVGVAIFARGVREIVRTVRIGRPAPERARPIGKRTGVLVREVLGHERFKHRPEIKVAHWVVMVSFPVLFLTLVTGYGQVANPTYSLPLIGHFIPLEWAIEAIGWASLFGILVLIVIRPGTAVFQWASVFVLASATSYGLYQILTRRIAGIDSPKL